MIKFRKGDIVSLQAMVRHDFKDGDEDVTIDIPGSLRNDNWIKPQFVTLVQQKIEVGDKVSFNLNPNLNPTQMADAIRVGQVLAISNDHAWIDLGGGDYCTRLLSTLHRVED